jgi:hypothetical protein
MKVYIGDKFVTQDRPDVSTEILTAANTVSVYTGLEAWSRAPGRSRYQDGQIEFLNGFFHLQGDASYRNII